MEEIRLLRDDADEIRQRLERQIADVDAVDRNRAAIDVVQSRGEVAERRLAGSGLADERRRRSGFDRERDVLDRPLVVVPKPHVVEADVTRTADAGRVRLLLDVDRLVEVLEDAVEEGERRLDVETDTQQRSD